MRVIDAHCDLLSKLTEDLSLDIAAANTASDVNIPRLREGGIALQWFAVYLSQRLGEPRFAQVLKMIDHFYSRVVSQPEVMPVRTRSELDAALVDGKIGAMLSLEGADGLEGDLANLRIAWQLGVRAMGVTWNHANWAADGVMEPRGGGFTAKGKLLLQECMRLGIILDVSHLAEAGFWELHETLRGQPFIASHSNAAAVCAHRRNLSDGQIEAIIRVDGRIGITFVPYFVASERPSIAGVLRHIEHICALGGAAQLGFGSDFDGIDEWVPELASPADYGKLHNELLKYYRASEVDGFLFRNWHTFLQNQLPQ
ncbi:MAG: dipeptidase [Paenibacillaceae bacterium]|nr:dipeptidase [Paenibacillaceae bacterium]